MISPSKRFEPNSITIRDGAAGVRGVNQYCVQKIVDGTAYFYNKNAKGYWTGFCTVLTKQEAKKVLKFMRKYDRQQNIVARKKVNISVSYSDASNVWTVDASTGLLGTCVSFIRKPTPKQLRQLRKAVAIAPFSTTVSYDKRKGKFVEDTYL
jgi:hypothetical protein